MIKGIAIFLLVVIILHSAFLLWSSLTSEQKWKAIKTMSYGAFLSVLALVTLGVIVYIF